MTKVKAEEVKKAFANKTKGRLYLLYLYFTDVFDDDAITSPLIVERVKTELNIAIGKRVVYFIRGKYVGKSPNDTDFKASKKFNASSPEPKEQEQKEEWVWEEPESYGDELRRHAARYLKNPPNEGKS
jgi:hypothetical protein